MERRPRVLILLALPLLALLMPGHVRADQNPPKDLMGAVQTGDAAAIKALLGQGADPNVPDTNGMTPLLAAVFRGDRACAEALLAAGAKPDAKDSAGITPLQAAAFKGSDEMAKLLLAKGASVNLRDRAGMTALHYAALSGSEDVVKVLLEAGADAGLATTEGLIPADVARGNGHAALADSLQRRAAEQAAAQAAAKAPHLYTNADVEKAGGGSASPSEAPPPSHPAQGGSSRGPQRSGRPDSAAQSADQSALYAELDKLAQERRDIEQQLPRLRSDCEASKDSHKQGESNISAGPGIVAGQNSIESTRRANAEEQVACRPLQQAQQRLQAIERRRAEIQRQIDSGGTPSTPPAQNRPNRPAAAGRPPRQGGGQGSGASP